MWVVMGDSDAKERVIFRAFVRESRSFWIVIQMMIMMGDSDDTDAEERHPLLFPAFLKEELLESCRSWTNANNAFICHLGPLFG